MAAQDLDHRLGDPEARKQIAFDRGERYGSIGLVLLVALILVGAAVGYLLVGRGNAPPYVLALLSLLAVVGVFSLFAGAAGILRLPGRDAGNTVVKSALDGASDSIAVTDPSGRVVYANAAYLALIRAAEPKDVRPVERVFIGDPDVSEAIYRLTKAAREGRRLQEEVRLPGHGGEPARWLRFRVRPLADTGRAARSTVWTVADVTRDRERQENVFQELQHAIDYLDHAPAGFFSVDAAGEIVYLNATLSGWLDYDLAQFGSGGLKLADIVTGESAALLTTLPAAPGEVKTELLDLDLKNRAGRSVPVRLFHKVAYAPDGSPGASRTLVLNRARGDGTDRERAAEVRFVRFFHNTPMAIATVDRSGRIARTNAPFAKLQHGVLKGEAQPAEGRSILAVVSEADRPLLTEMIARAADGQGDIGAVDATLAGDGKRSARLYVCAVEEDDPDGEAAIIYAIETTDQRALQDQITRAEKLKSVGQLAGGLAHDFNNLLGSILMATDFLLNAHRATDPSFQDIMQIKQSANRAASLVRQLLAFSRRQTLRPEVLDLGEVLEDLNIMLQRLIGEKAKSKVVHGRDLWRIKMDISQLEQVIVNLAVNARDAMPDGGKLEVRTSNVGTADCARYPYKEMPAADYVLIEVEDTGVGISPDLREKIFEPFFSTKEVGKGTGLGLSTVYGIVKQTGGFIYLESEVGKGTTFRIFLPRHVPGAAEVETAATLVPAPAAADKPAEDLTGHGTILLVEDEEGLRALNARGLASRGYTVVEAGNGIEAIREIEERNGAVDLVVSDVVMPEMDGPTLLKELRSRNPNLKMILVSGYAEDAFEKNLPEGGQFTFLAKPFTLKQLVATVKDAMAG
ncbi:MAG TPA: ATP-binding protein [Xanthobacteraceae bacterium]|jgi:two-component system cell cycle sensor histidine kinase/response regulator CckA|nr:ATP-binding protein [Xanthobacteraceae bacterium]